jgi:PAS domain-containing protein
MNTSAGHIKRKILVIALLLFGAATFLFLKTALSVESLEARHLFGLLVASYLIAWGAYALLSRVPRDEIRSQFVLMTFALVVALMLAELPALLKWIDYRQSFSISSAFASPWGRPNYVIDAELLALPRPYHSVRMAFRLGNIGTMACLPARPAQPFTVNYDQNGFRNDSDFTHADIAVIGDSYVEAQMLPGPSLATTHLAQLQRKTVVNLGQSGFGPQQELVVLKRYALALHPKSIIWIFYEGNDLDDAAKYEERVSRLRSEWNAINSTWDRSFTKNAFRAAIEMMRGCTPNPRLAESYGTISGEDGTDHQLFFLDHTETVVLTTEELGALKKTGEIIKAAYNLAKSGEARFVVVFAPTKFRVYHDIAKLNPSGDIKNWVVNDLPDRFRKIVADISPDIQYVDLTPALRTSARNNRLVFLPDDTHWSSEGQRVVAHALDEALKRDPESGVLAASHQSHWSERPSQTLNDILLVRNRDGTIRYWSEGARRVYGWDPREALGEVSHRLLKTVFPVPLDVIEAELMTRGFWEGKLIHENRNGSKVTVTSHWEIQQNPEAKDQSSTVVEMNTAVRS